jgi:hypothetical protein
MPKAPTGLVGASANRECNTKEDRGDGPIRLSDAWHMADTAGGYAWRYRIPQLYPPSRMQIPAQIQGASRSSGEPNQPRLALGAHPSGSILHRSTSVRDSFSTVQCFPSGRVAIMALSPMDVTFRPPCPLDPRRRRTAGNSSGNGSFRTSLKGADLPPLCRRQC